ncbi:hypothetical protein B0J13DRAFT_553378 [Dactylonectria estremocensis]|uniref:Uncharacterized protein n=1 Tax=Dactylonectria estremocensis TaxID=1079267 RepID=A0A9P9EXD0_9HYPO|nr:hypothetical protein B0J13DRAFT_553378 [Dactylonectria estremocensis]
MPNEGILAAEMTATQQDLVLAIAKGYLPYLPERARQLRLEQVRSWFSGEIVVLEWEPWG